MISSNPVDLEDLDDVLEIIKNASGKQSKYDEKSKK
jgi:hypothetical protein